MVKEEHPVSAAMEIVQGILRMRNISQSEAADRLGIPAPRLSEMLTGRRAMSKEVITGLQGLTDYPLLEELTEEAKHADEESVLRQPTWASLRLSAYEEKLDVGSLLRRFADEGYPDLERFKKRGRQSAGDKLRGLWQVLGRGVPTDRLVTPGCARKSAKRAVDDRNLATWVAYARCLTRDDKPTGTYAPGELPTLQKELRVLLHANEGDLMSALAECFSRHGIVFRRVGKEPNVEGYTWMRDDGCPTIVVTGRYNRIDSLAFTVMHEVAHLALGHVSGQSGWLSVERKPGEKVEANAATGSSVTAGGQTGAADGGDARAAEEAYMEAEADEKAQEALIEEDVRKRMPRVEENYNMYAAQYTLELWSRKEGLNPWIVLGRVSHELGFYQWRNNTSRRISGVRSAEEG